MASSGLCSAVAASCCVNSSILPTGKDRDNDFDGSAAMECTAPVVLQTLEQSHDPAWLPASVSAQASGEQSQAQLPSTQQPPLKSGQRAHAGNYSPGSPHASRAAEHSKTRAQAAGCDDRMSLPAQEVCFAAASASRSVAALTS